MAKEAIHGIVAGPATSARRNRTAVRLLLPLTMILAQSVSADTAPRNAARSGDAAQATQTAPAQDAENPPILVVGRLPHCGARLGDPLDSVDMAPAAAQSRQQVIKRDAVTGAFGIFPDDDPVTGPGIWQRAGTRMDQYVFRAPEGGAPLCIGARTDAPRGWGQLRQVVDAVPYRGKIVRVTMWAASRNAGRVWFWVASGRPGKPKPVPRPDMATATDNIEFRGTHGWTPVSLEMGPLRCDQEKLSFGFLLDGPGDLWIYKPQLEVIGTQSKWDADRDCRAVKGRP